MKAESRQDTSELLAKKSGRLRAAADLYLKGLYYRNHNGTVGGSVLHKNESEAD